MVIEENDYLTVKRSVTIPKFLDVKIEKIRHYPRWKGNRSAVYETALEEFILSDKVSKCIFCRIKDDSKKFDKWALINRKKGEGICKRCFEYLGGKNEIG